MLYEVNSIVRVDPSVRVDTAFTMPTPDAYHAVEVVFEVEGASTPLIVICVLVWQSTFTASNVPAGTVTDSVPPAVQLYVVSFLEAASCPLIVCVPSMI